MVEKTISEGYVSQIWPDGRADLPNAKIEISKILAYSKARLLTDEPYVIYGVGCGPNANIEFVKILVSQIREINKDLLIKLYFVDTSNVKEQLDIGEETFKKDSKIQIFCSKASFYDSIGIPNSVDFLFSFSCLGYADFTVSNSSWYRYSVYNGTIKNEKAEELSLSNLDKILTNFNTLMKKDGFIYVGEYGVSTNSENKNAQDTWKFFEKIDEIHFDVADKHNCEVYGTPCIFRNQEPYYAVLERNKSLSFEVHHYYESLDENCLWNFAIKEAKGDYDKAKNMCTEMFVACGMNQFVSKSNNPEDVKNAVEEFRKRTYERNPEDAYWNISIPATFVILKKK